MMTTIIITSSTVISSVIRNSRMCIAERIWEPALVTPPAFCDTVQPHEFTLTLALLTDSEPWQVLAHMSPFAPWL